MGKRSYPPTERYGLTKPPGIKAGAKKGKKNAKQKPTNKNGYVLQVRVYV